MPHPNTMHSTDATSRSGKVSRPVSPKTIPLRGCSTDSNTSKQSRLKNRPPRKSTSPSRHISPTSPASAYMLAVQSLDPRPLEELHNERSYLLHNLQKQGDRATKLFQRYAAVETRLAAAITPAETRKCKKEAAGVKTKIAESTQQEQLILLRLGEIHVELQNRDRWMLVHHQQPLLQPLTPLIYPPPLPPVPPSAPPTPHTPSLSLYPSTGVGSWLSSCQEDTPAAAAATTSSTDRHSEYFSCESRQPSLALSPLSPCFTPGVAFAEDIWSRASQTSGKKETTTATTEEPGEGSAPTGSISAVDGGVDGTNQQSRSGSGHEDGRGQGVGVERKELGRGGRCGDGWAVGKGVSGIQPVVEGAVDCQGGSSNVQSEEECRCTDEADATTDTVAHSNPSFASWDSDGASTSASAEEEDTQAWRAKLRRASLCLPLPSHLKAGGNRAKRMSLPYLKNMWSSRSRRDSLQQSASTAG